MTLLQWAMPPTNAVTRKVDKFVAYAPVHRKGLCQPWQSPFLCFYLTISFCAMLASDIFGTFYVTTVFSWQYLHSVLFFNI